MFFTTKSFLDAVWGVCMKLPLSSPPETKILSDLFYGAQRNGGHLGRSSHEVN